MSTNVNLERLANVFGLEMVSAEVNGEPAFALADIQDTDKILYGPVYDGEIVDQLMVLDYIRERLDNLDPDDVENLNLWDRDLIGHWMDGWWYDLYVMSDILTSVNDLSGDNIDTITEAAADQITLALEKIIEEIAAEL